MIRTKIQKVTDENTKNEINNLLSRANELFEEIPILFEDEGTLLTIYKHENDIYFGYDIIEKGELFARDNDAE